MYNFLTSFYCKRRVLERFEILIRCEKIHYLLFYWQVTKYDYHELQKCQIPLSEYDLFKVNQRKTLKTCEICSKLTIKTPERRRRSAVFIVKFENISHFFLVFLLLTLNK